MTSQPLSIYHLYAIIKKIAKEYCLVKLHLFENVSYDRLIFFSHEIVFDNIERFFHVRPTHSHKNQYRIRDHEKSHHFDTGAGPEPVSEALILLIAQISRIRLRRRVASVVSILIAFILVASTIPHDDHTVIICKY